MEVIPSVPSFKVILGEQVQQNQKQNACNVYSDFRRTS